MRNTSKNTYVFGMECLYSCVPTPIAQVYQCGIYSNHYNKKYFKYSLQWLAHLSFPFDRKITTKEHLLLALFVTTLMYTRDSI